MSLDAKRTLIFAVLKFLRAEIEQEAASADLKESLEGMVKVLYRSSLDSIFQHSSIQSLHLIEKKTSSKKKNVSFLAFFFSCITMS